MSSRKTAPKPRQITKSEIVRDDVFDSSVINNLEDELNYIRELAERLTNSEGYYHEQTVESSVWTIVHGLNRYPSIVIFDDELNQVFANVKMLNVNTVRITFNEPITGTAFLK